MKRNLLYIGIFSLVCLNVNAATVFDSMGNATEIKLAPAINKQAPTATPQKTVEVSSTPIPLPVKGTIKEEKFSNAITNLEDAQVELRQELASITNLYNNALIEKQKAVTNCRNLKKELNEIRKKIRNVEKSKKIISKNINEEE